MLANSVTLPPLNRVRFRYNVRNSAGFDPIDVQTRKNLIVHSANLLSTAEIPPQIPRVDLMDQLSKWAENEAGANGVRNFGYPMKVEKCYRTTTTPNGLNESMIWGFTITILRGAAPLCNL